MNEQTRIIQVGTWKVGMCIDVDKMLTVWINNDDKSEVHIIGDDISVNDQEWSDRFSTKKIEQDYLNEQ